MKKILALVVAFALCFTAIGGCLTTFAADAAADAALAVNAPDDLVAFNSAEIAVVVSGTGYTAYAAQELKVTFPDALTLKSIDGIDEFDAVGQANYKVATADGVTTVTLVQETPGDTFELTFKLGLAAANQSGYIKTYTVTASAEVGTDADDPVLYIVAEASDSFDVDCAHGATKLTSDATGHWRECNCSVESCEVRTETEEHTFGEDNICTVCGYVKVEEPEVCEHAWDDGVVTTKPTNDAEGVKTYTCTLCGETKTEIVPVVVSQLDPEIKTLTPQFEILETLNVCFRASKATTTDKYASAKAIVTYQKYNDALMLYTTTKEIDYVSITSKNNGAIFENITTYELDLPMEVYVACYDADGVQVAHSAPSTVTPIEVLKGLYVANPTTDAAIATNRMVTDTINLGATAQRYFPALINDTSSDLYKATKMDEGWDPTYASAELPALENVRDEDWNEASSITSTTNNITVAADLTGAPVLRYSILRAAPTGANPLDFSKLRMEVSYTTLYTTDKNPEVISDVIEGDEWNEFVDRKNIRYSFKKARLYDSNKTITTVITYDGVEVLTLKYSMDSYVAENAAADTLVYALGLFSASARNYFTVLFPGYNV